MTTARSNLRKAQAAKNDEFYTMITDIEKELKHYRPHFQGKVVFLNCDDHKHSNFFKFFERNMDFFGIEKLIATHYHETRPTYKIELFRDEEGSITEKKTPLTENGDFRSAESIAILEEADIVVSNPPFSLFREYIAQLISFNKKFLIIGNNNAVTYKEIFPLIKDGSLWLGVNSNVTMEFQLPESYEKWSRIDERGNKIGKVPAISWFTNLEHQLRNEALFLFRRYNEVDYPTYDNYDAIEVSKVADIPVDYSGIMGVPITFLTKYNPNQFEIVALGNSKENFTPNKTYINPKKVTSDGLKNGNAINNVLVYEIHNTIDKTYYTCDGKLLLAPYARILIQRKGV